MLSMSRNNTRQKGHPGSVRIYGSGASVSKVGLNALVGPLEGGRIVPVSTVALHVLRHKVPSLVLHGSLLYFNSLVGIAYGVHQDFDMLVLDACDRSFDASVANLQSAVPRTSDSEPLIGDHLPWFSGLGFDVSLL
jgi:hypothetical protein